MDTPKTVNRRRVTVENTNVCVTCQCISKVKYIIIDSKGTRGVACAIVETFYDVKFVSCQTNYGTYMGEVLEKRTIHHFHSFSALHVYRIKTNYKI